MLMVKETQPRIKQAQHSGTSTVGAQFLHGAVTIPQLFVKINL